MHRLTRPAILTAAVFLAIMALTAIVAATVPINGPGNVNTPNTGEAELAVTGNGNHTRALVKYSSGDEHTIPTHGEFATVLGPTPIVVQDYDFSGVAADTYLLEPVQDTDFDSIVSQGYDGQQITIINTSSQYLATLIDNSAGQPDNRIRTPGANNLAIGYLESVTLRWSGGYWYVVAFTG